MKSLKAIISKERDKGKNTKMDDRWPSYTNKKNRQQTMPWNSTEYKTKTLERNASK